MPTDDTPAEPLCGHNYTTLGYRVFSCAKPPHPERPNSHYFKRDLAAQDRANAEARNRQRRGSRLAIVPGERSDG